MKLELPSFALFVLALSLPASPSIAQTGSRTAQDAGASTDARPDLDAAAGEGGADAADAGADAADAGAPEAPVEGASDAKRIVRIRKVIDLDKQRLRWLHSELRSRTRWFEDMASGMAEVAEERNDARDSLEDLEEDSKADPEELAALRRKVEDLEEDAALYDTQTDLALKAEKTVREQIEALEKKIAREERALGTLTGEIQVSLPNEPVDEASAPVDSAKPLSTPLTRITPAPRPAQPRPNKEDESSSSMTAAQLEAHTDLERRDREVEIAKLALSEFVGRKRALQQQIEFEEGLQSIDAKELENLRHALELLSARLEKYREADVPAEKIQKRERGNQRISDIIGDLEKSEEARTTYLASLRKRLAHLEEAELSVTQEVDLRREEAQDARRHIMWLESPIHPRNVLHWAKERGPRILMVIAAAIFLLLFVHLSARRIARALVRGGHGARTTGTGRADTLAFSFRSVSRILIVVFGVLLVLQESGVDIKTVLGGAAILGVAIAFGAQDLMKDYFSGFLILAEDQYQLGDLVTIRGVTGTVESVNMRVTVLRDLEGRVHFIPNGNIDHVTNRTYAWGRPVLEIPVSFTEDVDMVMATLVEIAQDLRDDPDWKGSIIGEPEMLGVDKFTELGAVIKFMMKTQPNMLFAVRREMLRRISKRFNDLGIQISVPQRILLRTDA